MLTTQYLTIKTTIFLKFLKVFTCTDISFVNCPSHPSYYPPKYSLSFIAKKLKGRSSRILREEFPHLKEWCGYHLWAPSCFHGSVGQGWEVVERYFETQDVHYAKNAIYRPRP
ncbi:transposase [Candidatus Methanoperedens nitratireducens]|uniref:transposase n=1 Tax=Candidatus Methanoperedens nitratireducens TaxID=1392998 RepID=UPI0009E0B611